MKKILPVTFGLLLVATQILTAGTDPAGDIPPGKVVLDEKPANGDMEDEPAADVAQVAEQSAAARG